MRFRKLRIAFSVTCGIACLLLIGLWVRSYSKSDIVTWGLSSGPGYMFGSLNGELSAARFRSRKGAVSLGWSAWNRPADARVAWSTSNLSEFMGFRYKFITARTFLFAVPFWFPVMLAGAVAIAPWIRQLKWRFSLRTLLIAMTAVAVVLGLVVYFAG